MDRRQQLIATAAILSVAIGVVMVVDPGFAALFRGHTLALFVIGLIMVFLGYARYRRAKTNERPHYEPETPEEYPPIATPGDRFDASWDHHRFELAAIKTLARSVGCAESEAEQMLNDGSWTDDPYAAAYFSPYEEPSLLEQTHLWHRIIHGQSKVILRAKAVEEVAALASGESPRGEDTP